MADLNHRVTELENEIKVIKNEVKAILLDVREQYLNAENPFLAGAASAQGGQASVGITCQTDSSGAKSTTSDTENSKDTKTNDDKPEESASKEEDKNKSSSNSEEEISQQEENDKKGKKSTLPTLTMGPDSGDSKIHQSGKAGNKMKNVLGKFLPGDGDDDTYSAGDMQLSKETTTHKSGKQNFGRSGKGNGGNINLLTIAALSRWVDESTEKIGKERAEVMVEACYLVGHISSEFKDLLIRLVHLSQAEEPRKGRINTQDYLGVIARLDGLLGYNDGSESALLSILTDNKESHYG